MKKFLLILFSFLSISLVSFAQSNIIWYKATKFAFATITNHSYRWSDWETSTVKISINADKEVITIYSPTTQVYNIYGYYNNGNSYKDASGGNNIKFYVVDQDGDKGEIRLRIERNGSSQLYVDFNDCGWVYCVVRL